MCRRDLAVLTVLKKMAPAETKVKEGEDEGEGSSTEKVNEAMRIWLLI